MNLRPYDFKREDYLADLADSDNNCIACGEDPRNPIADRHTNPAGLAGDGGSLPLPAGPAGKVSLAAGAAVPALYDQPLTAAQVHELHARVVDANNGGIDLGPKDELDVEKALAQLLGLLETQR